MAGRSAAVARVHRELHSAEVGSLVSPDEFFDRVMDAKVFGSGASRKDLPQPRLGIDSQGNHLLLQAVHRF